ncbi:MAG: glycerophosphoryl diester phosphodiesterase membrane domain-containing protein [Acidobacteriota bacterium]
MFEEVLSETFSVFFKNIAYYGIIILIVSLPVMLLSYGLVASTLGMDLYTNQSDSFKMLRNFGDPSAMQDLNEKNMQSQKDLLEKFTLPNIGLLCLGGLILGLLNLMTHISSVLITDSSCQQQNFNLSNILSRAARKLPGLMVIAIIMGLACFFSGILIVTIPLSIYLAAKFSLSLPIYVMEDVSPFDAISRSFDLTRGKEWSIIGVVVIISVLSMVVSWVFGLLSTVAGVISPNIAVILTTQTIVKLVQSLVMIMLYISVYLFYAKTVGLVPMKGKFEQQWNVPKAEYPQY